MRGRSFVLCLTLIHAVLLSNVAGADEQSGATDNATDEKRGLYTGLTREPARRIVSMSPAVTEALFAFGAEDRIVGVSDSSHWPKETREKPRVGSILDSRIEEILEMNPDLVILTRSHALHRRPLEEAGVRVETVQTDSIERALWTFYDLAWTTECVETAKPLVDGLVERFNALAEQAKEKPRKRVLVCLVHEEESLEKMLILNHDNYLDQLLEQTNAVNAVPEDPKQALPLLEMTANQARETNPDVVIDLARNELDESTLRKYESMWGEFFEGTDKRPAIVVKHDPYLGMPGVRMDESLKKLIEWIHGENGE